MATLVAANVLIKAAAAPDDAPLMPVAMCHFIRQLPEGGGVEFRTRFWMGWQIVDRKPRFALPAGVRFPESVPAGLYESAEIDGAGAWQKLVYVTLPMMRNIIAITALFSLIVTFANFDIVRVLTKGDPLNTTHVFATWAFRVGIESGDIPLGSAVSLFMVPILAVAAAFILRDITKRGSEV